MDSIPKQKQMVSRSKSTVKSQASGLPRTAKCCLSRRKSLIELRRPRKATYYEGHSMPFIREGAVAPRLSVAARRQ